MTKREELYKKLRTIQNDDYLTSTCDVFTDTEEKVEEMLKAFDDGLIKTTDDFFVKILEQEYGYEAVHGKPRE